MLDKFTQFINDKFQYNQMVAMEILVQCGLKEQLFELAKVRTVPITLKMLRKSISYRLASETSYFGENCSL